MSFNNLANAARFLAVDMVQRANSGHPGAPMGMADMLSVLWAEFLRFNPHDPKWPNRDRFLMSNAHAGALQYALLYLTGFDDISLEDLKNFRQIGSKTAGHPEYGLLKGIEATGGPLGQGLAMAVGMALSAKVGAAKFGDDLINHKVYVTCGDGDLMEGLSEEAISLAGHLRLNNLIVLWDNNGITIDGGTQIATSTNQLARFNASGWQTMDINGQNPDEVRAALAVAERATKPVFIACKTTIGYGSPNKAGSPASHGAPLGDDEIVLARKALGWEHAAFEIPQDVLDEWRKAGERTQTEYQAWQETLKASPKAQAFLDALNGTKPQNFDRVFKDFYQELIQTKPDIATRKASQNTLEKITPIMPNLIGGSADLSASNLTKTSNSKVITSDDYDGSYIEYGIREHAMGAIMNGISLYGLFKAYGGTFFVFVDYLKPALRLAALMKQPVIYVLTHDSIGVGEDGATHQPIEQLAMLRAVPNLCTIRPCDALECAEAWQIALSQKDKPTALLLSRQKLPFLRQSADENLTAKGAYIISPAQDKPMATIIATGSEVSLAIDAQKALLERGVDVNVVSMPSWDLFEAQDEAYRSHVLGTAPRIAIEAASPFGWERYANLTIGINGFGASGPANKVYEKAGLTIQNVVEKVIDCLND